MTELFSLVSVEAFQKWHNHTIPNYFDDILLKFGWKFDVLKDFEILQRFLMTILTKKLNPNQNWRALYKFNYPDCILSDYYIHKIWSKLIKPKTSIYLECWQGYGRQAVSSYALQIGRGGKGALWRWVYPQDRFLSISGWNLFASRPLRNQWSFGLTPQLPSIILKW